MDYSSPASCVHGILQARILEWFAISSSRASSWPRNAVLGYNLKDHRKISCLFWRGGKPFNINVIQVYAPTTNVKEAEVEQFYKDLQDLLELTPKNRCPFHHRGLKCKSRKSRNTWRNRKVWPWSTKWSRAKAKRVVPREHTGHSKHLLPTNKRWIYTWTSPDGQYWN